MDSTQENYRNADGLNEMPSQVGLALHGGRLLEHLVSVRIAEHEIEPRLPGRTVLPNSVDTSAHPLYHQAPISMVDDEKQAMQYT